MLSQRSRQIHEVKPILSVFFIISTLFIVVFLKMEERRQGYEILKLTQEHRHLIEDKREKNMHLAKITRPQLVEKLAQRRLTLRKLQNSQIIHLSGNSLNSQNRELN